MQNIVGSPLQQQQTTQMMPQIMTLEDKTTTTLGFIRPSCAHYTEPVLGKLYVKFWQFHKKPSRNNGSSAASSTDSGACSFVDFLCLHCGELVALSFNNYHEILATSSLSHFDYYEDHGPFVVEPKTGLLWCTQCSQAIWNHHLHHRFRYPHATRPLKALPSSGASKALKSSIRQHCVALRGILNLGHTCFMSSVLQMGLHVDGLQKAFLSQPHCKHAMMPNKHADAECDEDCICLGRATVQLFNEAFCGQTDPFAPTKFLQALWQFKASLATYDQQDAHEFYLAWLEGIHACFAASAPPLIGNNCAGSGWHACSCPAHQVFQGTLKSEVQCVRCGRRSASTEPFTDISLHMLDEQSSGNDGKRKSLSSEEDSLRAALGRFLGLERLAQRDYHCSSCGSNAPATKQLSLLDPLPPCLVLHVKRYGKKGLHNLSQPYHSSKGHHKKDDRPMSFTLTLSVPFHPTTHSRTSSSIKKLAKYTLLGVIVHIGGASLLGGHYLAYLTHRGMWFRADDGAVQKVLLTEVLDCRPYMLFYGRQEGVEEDFEL